MLVLVGEFELPQPESRKALPIARDRTATQYNLRFDMWGTSNELRAGKAWEQQVVGPKSECIAFFMPLLHKGPYPIVDKWFTQTVERRNRLARSPILSRIF